MSWSFTWEGAGTEWIDDNDGLAKSPIYFVGGLIRRFAVPHRGGVQVWLFSLLAMGRKKS